MAQVGCKPKAQPEAAASAAPAVSAPAAAIPSAAPAEPTASEAASAAAPAATAELGMAKRYPHQEKVSSGTVRVLENDTKVYDEPDDKTPDVALLSKDLMVYRIATYGDDWILVEFPSGVGKVAPGWVQTKALDVKVNTAVKEDAVGKQKTTAKVVAPAGSATAAASASAAPAGTASKTATTTASTASKTTTASTAAGTATKTTTASTATKTTTASTATKTTTAAH
jgi:hypothetical protein